MLIKTIAIVTEILSQDEYIQRVKVTWDGQESKAIHYLHFHSPVKVGERVIINRTAATLNLGTGGYDFVIVPIEQDQHESSRDKGHIMKLRYTPYQFSVLSSEEQNSKHHHIFKELKWIEQVPVIIGELHSMLPIITTVIRQQEKRKGIRKKRIVYIMTDGAALPISFSQHVKTLKEIGWLDHTVTIGNAFGGDLEAINIFTGLIAAKHIFSADIIIVTMGPGITGTGTMFGHTGVEQGIIANAVVALKGIPITILRASSQDKRNRHKGISHHTLNTLKYVTLVKNIIPYPSFIKENPSMRVLLEHTALHSHQLEEAEFSHQQLVDDLKGYPSQITTMGRTIEEDPLFFDMTASAGYWIK